MSIMRAAKLRHGSGLVTEHEHAQTGAEGLRDLREKRGGADAYFASHGILEREGGKKRGIRVSRTHYVETNHKSLEES